MKKFLVTLFSFACVVSCALGLSACGETDDSSDTHEHSYQWVDNGDGTHKQHCANDGCDARDIEIGEHDYVDGQCVCGKVEPIMHIHQWSAAWDKDDFNHWHNCTASGCTISDNSQKDGFAVHDFTEGNCACGKIRPMLSYELNSDKESYSVSITNGFDKDQTSESIVIQAQYNGKPVTSIAESAFSHCSNLRRVTIPDSVTSIGESAFYYCDSLTSIIFTGTMAQWNAITKNQLWDTNTGRYTIHCTDGDLAKRNQVA